MTSVAEPRRHFRTAVLAGAIAVGMVGLAYASVPLYRIFCQVTGFGGTTQKSDGAGLATPEQMQALAGRTVKVRFDGNVRGGLPWQFAPAQGPMEIRIGEQNMAFYKASSSASAPTTGSATFNVSPAAAGKYFAKIQCFCFNEQTLNPGQTVEMPVVFYVDPAILDDPDARDIDEITLSYSFFPVAEPTRPAGIYATGQAAIPHRSP
jgi:cytochrome c oxidase assembly protein subunit 11